MEHSRYITRVALEFDEKYEGGQIKIILPDGIKTDILVMLLEYIDMGKQFPNDIDLYIASNVVTIAEALKMKDLEKKFLLDIIMPQLNRENVIFFLKLSHCKLQAQH